MTGYFRIGIVDRLRGLLTGRVRDVHAVGVPTVFRSCFDGAGVSIDNDAFGFGAPSQHTGPYLTIDVPAYKTFVACPCCRQVVDVLTIQSAPVAEMVIIKRLQALRRVPDHTPGKTSSLTSGRAMNTPEENLDDLWNGILDALDHTPGVDNYYEVSEGFVVDMSHTGPGVPSYLIQILPVGIGHTSVPDRGFHG